MPEITIKMVVTEEVTYQHAEVTVDVPDDVDPTDHAAITEWLEENETDWSDELSEQITQQEVNERRVVEITSVTAAEEGAPSTMTHVRVVFDVTSQTDWTGVSAIVDLPAAVDPADRAGVAAWLAANPEPWNDDLFGVESQTKITFVGVESVQVIEPPAPADANTASLRAALRAWRKAADGASSDEEHDAAEELAREVGRLLRD